MAKWIVCIEGNGEGCDYTIGCNKKFYETDLDDVETVEDFVEYFHDSKMTDYGGEDYFKYMSGFDRYEEHTYGGVYIAKCELTDISDALREKIQKDIDKKVQKDKKAKEKAELKLYKKLDKKYGKSVGR